MSVRNRTIADTATATLAPIERAYTRRHCRKLRYRSRFSAEMAVIGILLKGKRAGGRCENRAYPCMRCGGWHLTSQEAPSQ